MACIPKVKRPMKNSFTVPRASMVNQSQYEYQFTTWLFLDALVA